jgi:hypothetical protein
MKKISLLFLGLMVVVLFGVKAVNSIYFQSSEVNELLSVNEDPDPEPDPDPVYDIVGTFSEDFDVVLTPEELEFWSPNKSMVNDTPMFAITQEFEDLNGVLRIDMKQAEFHNGQMYNFKDRLDKLIDMTEYPYITFKVRVDENTVWKAPEWAPQGQMPIQASPYSKGVRFGANAIRIPIDGEWHEVKFNFGHLAGDKSEIDAMLIETVEWPDANTATFWIDDFKMGEATGITKTNSIEIHTAGDVTAIDVNGATLQFSATVLPTEADFKGVSWKVLPGSGYGRISAAGLFTPISDGTVKVVGITVDGTNLSDTIELTLSNQIDIVDTYNQNFNSADNFDINLWAPNKSVHDDGTFLFQVDRHDNALRIQMKQKEFHNGQLYDFKKFAGILFDLNEAPLISMRVRVDAATEWKAPEWAPQDQMPIQVSLFKNGTRVKAGGTKRVPIDGEWHNLLFLFFEPGLDLSGIDGFLVETVEWPDANSATFWIDDFRVGKAVTATRATELIVKGKDGVSVIDLQDQKLQMEGVLEPENTTVKELAWKVIPGTAYARIDAAGLLTPVSDGTLKVVGYTKDGSNLSDTIEITLANQTRVVATYSQNFNSDIDLYLWAPNRDLLDDGTRMFQVDRHDNALRVRMQQKEFFNGQMYNFKHAAGRIFDMSEVPLISIRVKIDPAQTEWLLNGNVPATEMPFGLSPWSDGARDVVVVKQVPIDNQWHQLYYSFAAASHNIDMSAIEWLLIESVTWPNANKALYWMDDFRVGEAVVIPDLVTEIAVSSEDDITTIFIDATVQLTAAVTPEEATFTGVIWTSSDETIATVNENGLVTGLTEGVATITAHAIDGSGVSESIAITVEIDDTSVNDLVAARLNVYPNPVRETMHIVSDVVIRNVRIINMNGQVVHNERVDKDNTQLSIEGFDNGIYIVQIITQKGISSRQVIINR